MAILPKIYTLLSRAFRYEPVMRLKDKLRPAKHFFVGKRRLYKVIDLAGELERKRGREAVVIFDVGAAVGEAAIPLAKAFPAAHIYCFEPLPDSFATLKERTAAFKNKIHYFNFGFFNKEGELDFYVDSHRDGSSLIPTSKQYRSNQAGRPEKIIKIKVRRLDGFCKEKNISRIDFLKIDVEGTEKEVLEGGPGILKNTDNVFVEISPLRKGLHSRDYIDVFEYLHQAGFSFAGIYEDYFFTKLL
jgi:FkbM family methyltransferase